MKRLAQYGMDCPNCGAKGSVEPDPETNPEDSADYDNPAFVCSDCGGMWDSESGYNDAVELYGIPEREAKKSPRQLLKGLRESTLKTAAPPTYNEVETDITVVLRRGVARLADIGKKERRLQVEYNGYVVYTKPDVVRGRNTNVFTLEKEGMKVGEPIKGNEQLDSIWNKATRATQTPYPRTKGVPLGESKVQKWVVSLSDGKTVSEIEVTAPTQRTAVREACKQSSGTVQSVRLANRVSIGDDGLPLAKSSQLEFESEYKVGDSVPGGKVVEVDEVGESALVEYDEGTRKWVSFEELGSTDKTGGKRLRLDDGPYYYTEENGLFYVTAEDAPNHPLSVNGIRHYPHSEWAVVTDDETQTLLFEELKKTSQWEELPTGPYTQLEEGTRVEWDTSMPSIGDEGQRGSGIVLREKCIGDPHDGEDWAYLVQTDNGEYLTIHPDYFTSINGEVQPTPPWRTARTSQYNNTWTKIQNEYGQSVFSTEAPDSMQKTYDSWPTRLVEPEAGYLMDFVGEMNLSRIQRAVYKGSKGSWFVEKYHDNVGGELLLFLDAYLTSSVQTDIVVEG